MSHHPRVQRVVELAAAQRAGPVPVPAGAKKPCAGCGKKAAGAKKPCGGCKGDKAREIYPGLVDPLQCCVQTQRDRNASVSHEQVWDHIDALQKLAEGAVPSCPEGRSGDGVILCGEGRYAVMAGMAVRSARESGWDGTIEVWHRPSAGGIEAARLDGLGVRLVDADAVIANLPPHQRPRILSGWGMKTFAALHSRLRRIFQLDADALLLTHPAPLFALLNEVPFAYWQDPTDFVKGPWHGLSRAEIRSIPPVNSGHMLFDVPGRWHELLLSRWFDDHEDHWCDRTFQPREKLHAWGDQDGHRVASAYRKSRFKVIGPATQMAKATVFVCDFGGRPAVVHRHGRKFHEGGRPARDDSLPGEARAWELYAEVATPAPPPSSRPYAHGMTEAQYARVVAEIRGRTPCRVLVFGGGHDTRRYVEANRGGRTVVLEDQPPWIEVGQLAGAETHPVRYATKVSDGLLGHCPALEVPASVLAERFDMILIDGPRGDAPDAPGRQQAAELASRLVAPAGIILAHDAERPHDAACYARHLGAADETVPGPPHLAIYRR